MKNLSIFLFLLVIPFLLHTQNMKSSELLEKSIQYHDPDGNWGDFQAQLNFEVERPNNETRDKTIVKIDLANEYFQSQDERGKDKIMREVNKGTCRNTYNNSADIPEDAQKKYRLNCERAKMFRDYYTYLYGLPMKLKDPGTQLGETVQKTTFQGQECWSLRVTYDTSVGDDIWYFYFHPMTYALIGYRFYHDEAKNDGEYITLKDEETVQGIKIPKIRHWYYNRDDKFLGADYLISGTRIE